MALPDRPVRKAVPTPPSLPRKPNTSLPAPPLTNQWGAANSQFDLSTGYDEQDEVHENNYAASDNYEDDYQQEHGGYANEGEDYDHEEYANADENLISNDHYGESHDHEVDDYEEEMEDELNSFEPSVQEAVEHLLEEILSDDSSEVIMNGPSSIHCKRDGQRVRMGIDFLDGKTYHRVINKFVLEFTDTSDRINSTPNMIEGQLELFDPEDENRPPMIARVHIMAPPAVKYATVTIAKKARKQFTLDNIYSSGAMSQNMHEFIKAITRGRLTTVFSGISGSGKTTLLEAASQYFDKDERLIVVEDTPELRFSNPDVAYLLAHKPRPNEPASSAIPMDWLVAQANRMRPDRIVIGETRGAEMAEFLVAANSGADGSMTTLHAQDPERACVKMAVLASKSGENRSESSIVRDIANTVHIVIQMALIDGKHIITEICEVSDIVNTNTGKIALTPLFSYDRRTKQHKAVGRPSEGLKSFLEARGVTISQSWFQRN